VTRFWLGKSEAGRLLGLATTKKAGGKKLHIEASDFRCLRYVELHITNNVT
jgi:hypothetical protein